MIFPDTDAPPPQCDPTKPNSESPWPHDYEHTDDEYDSLANGGSYFVYTCRRCGRVSYEMMPD